MPARAAPPVPDGAREYRPPTLGDVDSTHKQQQPPPQRQRPPPQRQAAAPPAASADVDLLSVAFSPPAAAPATNSAGFHTDPFANGAAPPACRSASRRWPYPLPLLPLPPPRLPLCCVRLRWRDGGACVCSLQRCAIASSSAGFCVRLCAPLFRSVWPAQLHKCRVARASKLHFASQKLVPLPLASPHESVSLRSEGTIDVYAAQRTRAIPVTLASRLKPDLIQHLTCRLKRCVPRI